MTVLDSDSGGFTLWNPVFVAVLDSDQVPSWRQWSCSVLEFEQWSERFVSALLVTNHFLMWDIECDTFELLLSRQWEIRDISLERNISLVKDIKIDRDKFSGMAWHFLLVSESFWRRSWQLELSGVDNEHDCSSHVTGDNFRQWWDNSTLWSGSKSHDRTGKVLG